MTFKEISLPAEAYKQAASRGCTDLRQFSGGNGLTVAISTDRGHRHITIMHSMRLPTLTEIYSVKRHFYPDVDMAMYFMAKDPLVRSAHLWEVKNETTANPE